MIRLSVKPKENGAAMVLLGPFLDQATPPNTVAPTTIVWTLSTREGVTINNRSNVSLTPAASTEFLISGTDLTIPDKQDLWRLLTVDATYTSQINGVTVAGIPLREQAEFQIEPFAVPRTLT